MSYKMRFRLISGVAETDGDDDVRSSVFEGFQTLSRTSARIEAKTVEIRNPKTKGVFTKYAKGRAAVVGQRELSISSNKNRDKD